MLANRSMPRDVLVPVLAYPDVPAAIAWLCGAFGFGERWRAGDHRAQLRVGETAALAIVRGNPPAADRSGDHLMIRVEDVDAHCARAQSFGAEIISAPTTFPYGERQYTVRDISGRRWVFSQSVADVTPEDWGGHVLNERRDEGHLRNDR
jgi:uncharacterized glyoxalase superfamily protein PhnB